MYVMIAIPHSPPLHIRMDSAPEVVGGVLARVLDNDSVLVDWSGTFRLNGLLQFYRLQRNSTAVFDGLDASTVLFSEPKGQGETLRGWHGLDTEQRRGGRLGVLIGMLFCSVCAYHNGSLLCIALGSGNGTASLIAYKLLIKALHII